MSAANSPTPRYLQSRAGRVCVYLEKHNLLYTNDGKENIVDDYCALLAATELFKATKDEKYKDAADRRATNLIDRLDLPAAHTKTTGAPTTAIGRSSTPPMRACRWSAC